MTNDIDELTALNLDFVASAQNPDVRRFGEILAPEFYCTNPDKSLVDRAAFLEQTAKPVTIRNLQAHDVKIRIMGNFSSSTLQPATPRPTGRRRTGDTPIAGRSGTENGSRHRRMWRDDAQPSLPGLTRQAPIDARGRPALSNLAEGNRGTYPWPLA
jgi:uncharacterized protein DUF4440